MIPFRRRRPASKVHGVAVPEQSPTTKNVRGWSADYIHERIVQAKKFDPTGESVLQSELRVIEAWRSPAARAFWISVVALVVSIAALYVSATKAADVDPADGGGAATAPENSNT